MKNILKIKTKLTLYLEVLINSLSKSFLIIWISYSIPQFYGSFYSSKFLAVSDPNLIIY